MTRAATLPFLLAPALSPTTVMQFERSLWLTFSGAVLLAGCHADSTAPLVAAVGTCGGVSAVTMGDFSVALWTDSLIGVPRTNIPVAHRFTTRNLRQLYQRLFDTGGGNVPAPFPMLPVTISAGQSVTASMVPGTMAHYIVDLSARTGKVPVYFMTPTGAPLARSLVPQVSVYRLP